MKHNLLYPRGNTIRSVENQRQEIKVKKRLNTATLLTLIITQCAGRFTPQAKVEVQTKTLIKPSPKYFSTMDLRKKTNNFN